jgi:uncharacterized protein YukE
MKIAITIEINETDPVFDNFTNAEKLSVDIAYTKYKFDILKDEQEKRLEYIATEASLQQRDVLVGNICYNLYEILYFNNELKRYNLSLDTVFIPSAERIEQRLSEAKENARLHGRWIGSSVEEVENSFNKFKLTLQEIKDELGKTAIKVVEC